MIFQDGYYVIPLDEDGSRGYAELETLILDFFEVRAKTRGELANLSVVAICTIAQVWIDNIGRETAHDHVMNLARMGVEMASGDGQIVPLKRRGQS